MRSSEGYLPDWRNAAAYEPLLNADRSLFAWEWLRRDRSYRAAAERALDTGTGRNRTEAGEMPERWGLHAFEPPSLTVPDARPVWRAEVHPYVLGVQACPSTSEDVFDFQRFKAISTLVRGTGDREHLFICDGFRGIRIDVLEGSIAGGPVELRYQVAGFVSAERPLLALQRLLALWRTGRFSAGLHPTEARAGRNILVLRAYDALASGATQREIAAELLSVEAERDRWRVCAPTVRSQVQRLVRTARAMAAGGYSKLLGA